jgi:probable F420-dependent oxidoreductase
MSTHKFRFGVVAGAGSGEEWLDKARRVESLGFNTLVLPDTLQYSLAPFPALAAAAAATRTLRVGTFVLANDYRHPVLLAKEAATLDFISGGRLELGIGAGRPASASDNAMLGLPFDSGAIRVDRLAETLAILKPLFAGQTVDFSGTYYTTSRASIAPTPVQAAVPILIAAGQPRLLELAAREADIVTLAIQPEETEAQVTERIELMRKAAGDRFSQLEININLMAVGGQVPRHIQMSRGAEYAQQLAESDAIPVLKGSIDQMCDRLEWLRDKFAISYIMVSDQLMDALAPVVARFGRQSRGLDALPRVERIAQAVADEIDGQHSHRDGHTRRQPQPRHRFQNRERLRLVEHIAPGRLWRADAQAEERQRRFEQNRLRDRERCRHRQRRQHRRHQMARDDLWLGGAERSRGEEEILLAQAERQSAHDAARGGPVEQADTENDGLHARADQGHHRENNDEDRERQHYVGRAHDYGVDPAGVHPSYRAEQQANRG